MNHVTLTFTVIIAFSALSQTALASDRADLSDITMEIIRHEDAAEILNEIELPTRLEIQQGKSSSSEDLGDNENEKTETPETPDTGETPEAPEAPEQQDPPEAPEAPEQADPPEPPETPEPLESS